MRYTDELAEKLRGEEKQLEEGLERCRHAIAVLEGTAQIRLTPPRAKSPQRRSNHRKPGPVVVSQDEVLKMLGRMPGSTSRAVAEALGARSDRVLAHFHELQDAGLVTRDGERAKTRWTPVEA